jgi:hypothetical protein
MAISILAVMLNNAFQPVTVPRSMFHKRVIKDMAIAGQVLLGMMTLTEILSSARWASLNSMRLNTYFRLAQRALLRISVKVIIPNSTWPAMAISILAVMHHSSKPNTAITSTSTGTAPTSTHHNQSPKMSHPMSLPNGHCSEFRSKSSFPTVLGQQWPFPFSR